MPNARLKCCGCKTRFERDTMLKLPVGWFCGLACVTKYAKRKADTMRARADRKRLRELREKAKTKSEHLRDAQAIFNKYIRTRDQLAGYPCISCQRYHDGQYHAGHYRPTSSASHLRFNEDNVHLQCAPCNTHLSGNLTQYRKHLIEKIGLPAVEALEADNTPYKWSVDEILELKALYRRKLKELEAVT